MKVMDMLYDGGIYPCEDVVPRSEEYLKLNRDIETICHRLSEKLGGEDYSLVEELCNQMAAAGSILHREYFKYGLSLGLRLMLESEKLPYIRQKGDTKNE